MRATLVASGLMFAIGTGAGSAQQIKPDYEVFKTKVQPIFLSKRAGRARCVACHQNRTGLALAVLSPGASTWSEEQTRHNSEIASQFVVPGQPAASRLLMHPLAPAAGGD